MATDGGGVPGWLVGAGWGLLALSVLGLPTALLVAGLDAVWRSDDTAAQRVLLGVLVVLAVVLVIAAERGLTYLARESVPTAAWTFLGLVVVVLLGVFVPGLGLVLTALGVLVGLLAATAGAGALAWWRWGSGPRPTLPPRASQDEVRAAAEARRAAVRDRHARTVEAVARGYVGPGFTRGD